MVDCPYKRVTACRVQLLKRLKKAQALEASLESAILSNDRDLIFAAAQTVSSASKRYPNIRALPLYPIAYHSTWLAVSLPCWPVRLPTPVWLYRGLIPVVLRPMMPSLWTMRLKLASLANQLPLTPDPILLPATAMP